MFMDRHMHTITIHVKGVNQSQNSEGEAVNCVARLGMSFASNEGKIRLENQALKHCSFF